MSVVTERYLEALKSAESFGGVPTARNPRSSASGLYQFTQRTWTEELVLPWDQVFNPVYQERAIRRFTELNAQALQRANIPVTPDNLYAAHFLGRGGAVAVLRSPDNVSFDAAYNRGLGPGRAAVVRSANPQFDRERIRTVGDFRAWVSQYFGRRYAQASGQAQGTAPTPESNRGFWDFFGSGQERAPDPENEGFIERGVNAFFSRMGEFFANSAANVGAFAVGALILFLAVQQLLKRA